MIFKVVVCIGCCYKRNNRLQMPLRNFSYKIQQQYRMYNLNSQYS